MSEFPRCVCRVAVAQLCQALGFHAVQESALDSLVDIVQYYLEDAGHGAHRYAELASRVEGNLMDTAESLRDMGAPFEELRRYAVQTEELSFAKVIPKFPVKRPRQIVRSTSVDTEPRTLPSFMFPYLPPLPETHSYVSTSVYETRPDDPKVIRKVKNKERRQVEVSLTRLAEVEGGTPVANYTTSAREYTGPTVQMALSAKRARMNPFLAEPSTEDSSQEVVPEQQQQQQRQQQQQQQQQQQPLEQPTSEDDILKERGEPKHEGEREREPIPVRMSLEKELETPCSRSPDMSPLISPSRSPPRSPLGSAQLMEIHVPVSTVEADVVKEPNAVKAKQRMERILALSHNAEVEEKDEELEEEGEAATENNE
eukprot:TRINITY_DN39_c0_g1_i1.p1 TRINITY_DN39_c0_g1~~TRINITY_DN39_c0_g1_i1.p1  ORF type:complete len:370 (-),score=61.03 TRINITY_DN39_c0_g1_i1:590-1699(-)